MRDSLERQVEIGDLVIAQPRGCLGVGVFMIRDFTDKTVRLVNVNPQRNGHLYWDYFGNYDQRGRWSNDTHRYEKTIPEWPMINGIKYEENLLPPDWQQSAQRLRQELNNAR
jgi:hypothetical protein